MIKSFDEYMTEKARYYSPDDFELVLVQNPSKNKANNNVTVGATWVTDSGGNKIKGANILKTPDGKYFAASGSWTSVRKNTTFHDTPEEASDAYHKKNKMKIMERR